MPRLPSNVVPSYRRHKHSGRAIVTLSGRDYQLGEYDSPESWAEYHRLTTEWQANGRRPLDLARTMAIAELILAFRRHVESYYRDADGHPTKEQSNFAAALKIVRELYGKLPADQFGPLALKAVRSQMVAKGWARTNVNRAVGRVKLCFKWGVENEIIPPSVHHGLSAVRGLSAGRSGAREPEPVKPVPEEIVNQTLPHMPRMVADMVRIQLLTGARPGEICAMRSIDIDTTGTIWIYRPPKHKTLHHGHAREILIGKRAQSILRPRMTADLNAFIFSPKASEQERLLQLQRDRKSPMTPSQLARHRRRMSGQRKHPLRDRYTTPSYRRAITRACEVAFDMPTEYKDPHPETKAGKADTREQRASRQKLRNEWHAEHAWHPHQLRHLAATKLRKEFGIEAAGVILGHKNLKVTELYAEKNIEAAHRIMGQIG